MTPLPPEEQNNIDIPEHHFDPESDLENKLGNGLDRIKMGADKDKMSFITFLRLL